MNTEVHIRGIAHVNSDEFLSDGSSVIIQVQLLIAVCRKLILTINPIFCSYNVPLLHFLSYN